MHTFVSKYESKGEAKHKYPRDRITGTPPVMEAAAAIFIDF